MKKCSVRENCLQETVTATNPKRQYQLGLDTRQGQLGLHTREHQRMGKADWARMDRASKFAFLKLFVAKGQFTKKKKKNKTVF